MNNDTNDPANEMGGFQWPAVFEYKADDALFVRCKRSDGTLCHIKLRFDGIVSILTTDSNEECTIYTMKGTLTADAALADIIACLPESKFVRIRWNEVLNLSLVDRIDGNIFYVGRTSYSVGQEVCRGYSSDIHEGRERQV